MAAAKPKADNRTRPTLDRRKISAAALTLIDERGIEHLSMRSIGAALDVEAMALYHHFSNKAALLDGVRDLLLDEAAAQVPAQLPPPERLRATFHALRTIGLRHPDIVVTLGTYRYRSARARQFCNELIATFAMTGMEPEQAARLLSILAKFTLGSCLYALAIHGNGAADADLDAVPASEAVQFPFIDTIAPFVARESLDQDFAVGLDLLWRQLGSENAQA